MEFTSVALVGLLMTGGKIIWEKIGDQATQDAYEKVKAWFSKKPELKDSAQALIQNPDDGLAELKLIKALDQHKAYLDQELIRLAKDFEAKLAQLQGNPQAANQGGVTLLNSHGNVIASGKKSIAAGGNVTITNS